MYFEEFCMIILNDGSCLLIAESSVLFNPLNERKKHLSCQSEKFQNEVIKWSQSTPYL